MPSHQCAPKCVREQEKRGVIKRPPETSNVFQNDTVKAIRDQVAKIKV